MNKLGGIKMKNNKVRSKKREYDTYSITMELEKPLLYEEEQEEISAAKPAAAIIPVFFIVVTMN